MTPPLLSSFEIDALEAGAAEAGAGTTACVACWMSGRNDWRELTARLGCVSIHLNHKLLG